MSKIKNHICSYKCTEACKWNDRRLGLWEVELDGKKVSIFINKDGTYGYAYLEDGVCYANYHKICQK